MSQRFPVRQQLSAANPIVMRVVAPVGIAIVTLVFIWMVEMRPGEVNWQGGVPPWWASWAIGAGGVFGVGLLRYVAGRVVDLSIEGEEIIASVGRRTVRIPLTEVATVGVMQGLSVNDRPVLALELTKPCSFGERLEFVPADEFVGEKLWRSVETAKKHRARAASLGEGGEL